MNPIDSQEGGSKTASKGQRSMNPKGNNLGVNADGTPRAPHPITGKPLAEKTKAAFDAKNMNLSLSTFKSFQAILIEQARLMSWLWGGAAAVGVLAYAFGKSYKKEHNKDNSRS